MLRLLALASIAIAIGVFARPGAAQGKADPCRTEGRETDCYIAHQQDYVRAFGLPVAASRLAAGEAIRRSLYFTWSTHAMLAIEFRRAPGQEPTVSLYLPREPGSPPMQEPSVSASVPLEEWDRLTRRGRFFDRPIPPLPMTGEVDGEAYVWVCGDGGLDVVEVTQPGEGWRQPPLRQRVESTCDDGLVNDYADQLAEAAVRLIPACAALDDRRDARWRLRSCAMLRGDRLAAGEVLESLDDFRDAEDAEVRVTFGSGSTLDWMGEQSGNGRAAAERWIAHMSEPGSGHFFARRVEGETADRVRVHGILERSTGGSGEESQLWNAPVEMVWTRRTGWFQLQSVVVRPFERVDQRCHPARIALPADC